MKKIILTLIVLLHAIPMHGSENKSWYQSPRFMVSLMAAAGAATTVVSWWAIGQFQNALKYEKTSHKNDAKIEAAEKAITKADAQNKELYEDHMSRQDGGYSSPPKVKKLSESLKHVDSYSAQFQHGIESYDEHYSVEFPSKHQRGETGCDRECSNSFGSKRTHPCTYFATPYRYINDGLTGAKNRLHEPYNKRKQQIHHKLAWARTLAFAGTATTSFACGYLYATQK